MRRRTHTLLWLVGLSLSTTLLARFAPGGVIWASLAFLALAGWKARLVLNGYLGLDAAPFWSRGFNTFVIAFLILVAGLYLLPML